MKTLVWKEVRLILPAWLMAVLLAVLPAWYFSVQDLVGWQEEGAMAAFVAFALGAVFLGLTPFGQECALGTFSVMLAQPVSRRRVWQAKVGVVVAALLLVLAVLVLSYGIRIQALPSRHILALWTVSALVALAGGLWTTLLFRQVAAALWFTFLVPPVILIATSWLWKNCSENVAFVGLSGELLLYSVAGFYLARRLFLRAQDTSWTGGTVALPAWMSFGARARSFAAIRQMPIRALIKKEFQSHHVALLIGAGMLVVHLAVIAVRKMAFDPAHSNDMLYSCLEQWWALWLGLPFLVGSTAVAEERKLGTLESQLCLPTTRRVQFAVKLVTALFLGIVLGGVMPWVAEGLGGLGFVLGSFSFRQSLTATCLASGAITFVSFYASTLTRNLLQAMGVALVVGLALATFVGWATNQAFGGFDSSRLWVGPLVEFIGLPTLLVVLLWLAFRNYKHVYVGSQLWRRNLLVILGAMGFIVIATTLIYNRTWQLMMTLEPKHGPARLSGPISPKICTADPRTLLRLPDGHPIFGRAVFVLLPDGRLWVANQYQFQATGEYDSFHDRTNRTERLEEIYLAVPVGGEFLSQSNWVTVAGSYGQVVGIQSDGSLWNIFSTRGITSYFSAVPKPERIGTASDWKSVSSGYGHFLALKQDGTLWGWGHNDNNQLGPGPKEFSNGPVRIGADSDWRSVFARRSISLGIKRDGSVWKWGWLSSAPPGDRGKWTPGAHPEPVRWNLDGTDWLVVEHPWNLDLILKRDGTLWAVGEIPRQFLGHYLLGKDFGRHFSATPLRVDPDSDWADTAMDDFNCLALLKRDGSIRQSYVWGFPLVFWGGVWQPSKYSDWRAIATLHRYPLVTLAADGTLCAWRNPVQEAYENMISNEHGVFGFRLLGPSRRPLWSVNVLAGTK
jgi:ABC-type transport system involved in multi-copper enzyme maturation permease subunit